MTDKEVEDILNTLTTKITVLENETLHQSLLIVGICQALNNDLKVDICKMLDEIKKPELMKFQLATHDEITRQVEEILKNDNHGDD